MAMLNIKYKKDALADLKTASAIHQKTFDEAIKCSVNLHSQKAFSKRVLIELENYINTLTNTPKNFSKTIGEIKINRIKFEAEINELQIESSTVEKISKSILGVGVTAGAGVATFAPTAAMAIATTFGTASTGTAIATLSGAAATNAALAWLGGGALVAGGGGMVAGESVLALAGPAGWVIGGTLLLGSGIFASCKNKQIAEKAESQTVKVKEETAHLIRIKVKIEALLKEIQKMNLHLGSLTKQFVALGITNYKNFSDEQLNLLQVMLNTAHSLSAKLCEKVS